MEEVRPIGSQRWAGGRSGCVQLSHSIINQGQHGPDIEILMSPWVFCQIGLGESEERRCRPWPVLLPMDKRAGQLDQPFVECAIGSLPLGQPKGFQRFVGLEEALPVEALEEAQVTRVVILGAHCWVGRWLIQVSKMERIAGRVNHV